MSMHCVELSADVNKLASAHPKAPGLGSVNTTPNPWYNSLDH